MGDQVDELLGRYDDTELSLLLDFFQRSRAVAAARVAALQGEPQLPGQD
jgi:hypothetical protein